MHGYCNLQTATATQNCYYLEGICQVNVNSDGNFEI